MSEIDRTDVDSAAQPVDALTKILTTDKQKWFLRNRLAGLNKRQAAIRAGYSAATASVMANRITHRLTCNEAFIDEMRRQGLTIETIVGEIKRGVTEAMHPQNPTQPDNYNRRAYTEMAIKLYGGFAPTKIDLEKHSRHDVYVDLMTIKLAEEVSGEKYLDADGNPVIRGDETKEELESRQYCIFSRSDEEGGEKDNI